MGQMNLGSISIADHDEDWLRVSAAVKNTSMRVLVSSALSDFVSESKPELTELIGYAANKHGLTFEQAFHRLRSGEELGEPLPNFPLVTEMEEKLNGLTQK